MGAVGNGIFAAAPCLFIEYMYFTVPVHNYRVAGFTFYGMQINELYRPVVSGLSGGMLLKFFRPTYMECPHRKLGSWLAYRLSSHNTYGFAYTDKMSVRKIPAVAHGADTVF